MTTIGVITCAILEDEIALLLATEKCLCHVTVLENHHSERLVQQFMARSDTPMRCIPHISSFTRQASQECEALVRVLAVGLHRSREILQRSVREAAREMRRHVQVIFLGYGMCGNVFAHPTEVLDVDIPVFIARDGNTPVDDCVSLQIGGRSAYLQEQKDIPGTFFMTPGWARHWPEGCFVDGTGAVHAGVSKMFQRYTRALLLPTEVMAIEEIENRAAEFTQRFALTSEVRAGTLQPLKEAWKSAMACLMGLQGPVHGGPPP